MRLWSIAFILLVGISLLYVPSTEGPSAASARPSEPSSQGEHLLFVPPANFQSGYHDDRVGSLTEFVPNGESVENWTEMITVQVFQTLKVDPAHFLQTLGGGYAKSCPGFSSPRGIITGQSNGHVVSVLTLRCPLNPATGKPETTVFRVIKGQDALYSMQHAWRSSASDKDLDDAVAALGKVTLCDTHDASHPCPSPGN